jgi:hypothetical protein
LIIIASAWMCPVKRQRTGQEVITADRFVKKERHTMKFTAYRRANGSIGIRNHVIVIPSAVCANRVVRGISQLVTGTTWVEHRQGLT